jgi:protein kinase A
VDRTRRSRSEHRRTKTGNSNDFYAPVKGELHDNAERRFVLFRLDPTMLLQLSIRLYMFLTRCVHFLSNFNYPHFFFRQYVIDDLSFIWKDSYYHVGLSLHSFSARLHDRLFYEHFDVLPLRAPSFRVLQLVHAQPPHLVVHLAVDQHNGRLVRLRQYDLAQLIRHEQLIDQLLDERKLSFAIDFWCFARTFAHFEHEQRYFFVQEDAHGLPLSELIDRFNNGHGLPENWVRFVAAQLLIAIEYLHKAHVLMRDIRPDHVLIHSNGYVKLVDLSQCIRLEFDEHSSARVSGRVASLSPEFVYSQRWTTASDWWMFGVLLYQMVVGTLPFESPRGLVCTLLRIMLNRRRLPIWLSFELKDLLNGTLHLHVQTRYTSNKIAHHRWFEQIDFRSLVRRQSSAPAVHRLVFDAVFQNRLNQRPKAT